MPYYHTFIHTTIRGKEFFGVEFNFNEEHVKERIAKPYMNKKSFMFGGKVVNPSGILEISIFRSEKLYQSLVLPNGKSPIDERNGRYRTDCFARKKVEGVFLVTRFFITSPPQEKEKPIKTPTKPVGNEEKVFIIHGRDEKQALRLQKYLTRTLKIDAEMFEDYKEKSGSNTIIEQLEYIRDNVGYAFVIVTPDDLGCLREEMEKLKNKVFLGKESLKVEKICKVLDTLKTRARQNVVFEHGVFIGALGRDRVCCLFQEDTEEKPSDTDGILYVGFKNSVKETFPEITEKLKKAHFIKT